MPYARAFACLCVVSLLGGCGSDEEAPRCFVASAEPLVLGQFRFARSDVDGDPFIVPGFDLDARVSDGSDASGCFHADFRSPDGLDGVDNRLGPLTRHIPAEWYATGIGVNTSYRDAMLAGELTLAIQLTPDAEGCAAGAEWILNGERHPAVIDRVSSRGLEAHFAEPMVLPVHGGLEPVEIHLAAGVPLEIQVVDGETTGTLGGSITVDDAVAAWTAMSEADIDRSFVQDFFLQNSDLDLDATTGECRSLSSAWTFSTEPWPPPMETP